MAGNNANVGDYEEEDDEGEDEDRANDGKLVNVQIIMIAKEHLLAPIAKIRAGSPNPLSFSFTSTLAAPVDDSDTEGRLGDGRIPYPDIYDQIIQHAKIERTQKLSACNGNLEDPSVTSMKESPFKFAHVDISMGLIDDRNEIVEGYFILTPKLVGRSPNRFVKSYSVSLVSEH